MKSIKPNYIQRRVDSVHLPIATDSNRGKLISIYMHCEGLTFEEAIAKFKEENRRAWARACS